MTRWAYVRVGDTPAPKKWGALMKKMRVASYEVEDVTLTPTTSRAAATAMVMATEARSVLLLGGDTIGIWRPDLKVGQMQGVPMMLGWEYEGDQVAVSTLGWAAGFKTKPLTEQLEDAVGQWVWRGRMPAMGRWPETCVRCKRQVDQYDVCGLAWCDGCYPGAEPPAHAQQLGLVA